jgi:Bacterial regulatory proteins, luxR family
MRFDAGWCSPEWKNLELLGRRHCRFSVPPSVHKQASGELSIREITAKAHRGKAMQKMQANSFADLVKMAVRLQIPVP